MTSRISKTRITKRMKKKTDVELQNLIIFLKKQKKPIWLKTARYLARPRRKKISVNLEKINKVTEPETLAVIPGKVLAKGNLNHKLTIACFSLSEQAKKKLKEAKAEILSFQELVKKLADFKGIKIKLIT